jgi:hypothetical protein
MKSPVHHWYIMKDSWCLVPFSSNISCDRPQRGHLLARIRTRVPYVSQRYCIVLFQWGAQQQISATKQNVHYPLHLTATLGRVIEASFPVMLTCCYCKVAQSVFGSNLRIVGTHEHINIRSTSSYIVAPCSLLESLLLNCYIRLLLLHSTTHTVFER